MPGYVFVILHVDDKQDAHVKTRRKLRIRSSPLLSNRKLSWPGSEANALVAQARTGGLDKAAAAKNMQVLATDFISRMDSLPGIGSSPQFTEAVFTAAEKSPPDEVQVPQGFAIYEFEAIKPPARRPRQIHSRVENGIEERTRWNSADPKDAGTFRPRQG